MFRSFINSRFMQINQLDLFHSSMSHLSILEYFGLANFQCSSNKNEIHDETSDQKKKRLPHFIECSDYNTHTSCPSQKERETFT